ncbi:hypothetical protein V5N11_004383 [Cardamine amara subsp. amara]|uniref:Uncharacterized protein n=1 Tax=Cardamine amara subsp. amara TaxID=228776 RepID=A0ABD1AFT3_CARAN
MQLQSNPHCIIERTSCLHSYVIERTLCPYVILIYSAVGALSQPRQNPFDFMSRDLVVPEEGSNTNNGDSQFQKRITILTNDGLRQEPPSNGTTAREENVDATPFDIIDVCFMF